MKIVAIVGTRPQFIKHAALLPKLSRHYCTTIHTGQHYDKELSLAQFNALHLPQPLNLDIPGGNPTLVLGSMLKPLCQALAELAPDLVIVYGDTTSTLAGSLAAKFGGYALIHVEAGLRSGEKDMPEEINRITADHLSDLLFAPTEHAVSNLYREGLGEPTVLTGDLMYEILQDQLPNLPKGILKDFSLKKGEYILFTLHRAANTDNPKRLRRILAGLAGSQCKIVFPIHPRTRIKVDECGWEELLKPFLIIPPQTYQNNLALLKNARLCITDSGGMQKEAFFLGIPCLTLRKNTEWVETLAVGANHCVDDDPVEIKRGIINPPLGRKSGDLVGDPSPSTRIVAALESWWQKRTT